MERNKSETVDELEALYRAYECETDVERLRTLAGMIDYLEGSLP